MSWFTAKKENEAKHVLKNEAQPIPANNNGTGNAPQTTDPTNPAPQAAESTTPDTTSPPPRELDRCIRCSRHYLTSQLNNPYLDMTCGRYHPGHNASMGYLISLKGEGLSKAFKPEYLNAEVWSCCLQPCVIDKGEGYFCVDSSNACANYDGKHQPGGE